MASRADALAAICILTIHPNSQFNRAMNSSSLNLSPSPQILLRWCLFDDEGSPRERAQFTTVTLKRPDFVSSDRRYQCVAKILAWLAFARQHYSAAAFTGWMDSDTFLLPQRLESYLARVATTLPPRKTPTWIGLFMHWSRFDTQLLDGFGLMHAANKAQEDLARKLQWDRKENRQYLIAHQAALGKRPEKYRKLSFAMTQGAFTLFSRSALRALLAFLPSATAKDFLGLGTTVPTDKAIPLRRLQKGHCTLPTDVALGWLMTKAFAGDASGQPLHAINLQGLFEYFVWEGSRVNPNHTLVVHLAQAKNGNYTRVLRFYEKAFDGGRARLTPPTLMCNPAGWTHTASKQWIECSNVAQCELAASASPPPPPVASPPPPPPTITVEKGSRRRQGGGVVPPLAGWLPAGTREVCDRWRSSRRFMRSIAIRP